VEEKAAKARQPNTVLTKKVWSRGIIFQEQEEGGLSWRALLPGFFKETCSSALTMVDEIGGHLLVGMENCSAAGQFARFIAHSYRKKSKDSFFWTNVST